MERVTDCRMSQFCTTELCSRVNDMDGSSDGERMHTLYMERLTDELMLAVAVLNTSLFQTLSNAVGTQVL